MTDLDDPDLLSRRDSTDVLGAVENLSEQCRRGWELGRAAQGLPAATNLNAVAVCGMGGSGAAGDLVKALVEPRLPVPFIVIKGYNLLYEWVGRNSLVVCVSYSGGTEETLEAFDEARERGARIVTISSGGPLAERAAACDVGRVLVPAGLQPRASLCYLAMPILGVLCDIGLVPDAQEDVDEAVAVLAEQAERCHRKRAVGENPAKDLAVRLHGKLPVVFGSAGLTSMVASRFKADLNEYAKIPAFWSVLPEANHNDIEGWAGDPHSGRDFVGVLLRDLDEHPRLSRHFEILKRHVRRVFSDVVELYPEGRSLLARALSLELTVQLAAIYLGLLRGRDPGPVEVLETVKRELKIRAQPPYPRSL